MRPTDPVPDSAATAAAPLLVRRREAARLCGLSPASWDRLAASGRCQAPIRLGSAVLWSTEELRSWVAAGCPTGGPGRCCAPPQNDAGRGASRGRLLSPWI